MKTKMAISISLLTALIGGVIGFSIANSRVWPIMLQTAIAWDELYLEQLETDKYDHLIHILSDKIAQNLVELDAAANKRIILHLWIPRHISGSKWPALLERAYERTASRRQEIEYWKNNPEAAKQQIIDTLQKAMDEVGMTNQVIKDIHTSGGGIAIEYK